MLTSVTLSEMNMRLFKESCTPDRLVPEPEGVKTCQLNDMEQESDLSSQGRARDEISEDTLAHRDVFDRNPSQISLDPDSTLDQFILKSSGLDATPMDAQDSLSFGELSDESILSTLSEVGPEKPEAVTQPVRDDIEISQYDIWSDYDQAELDVFDETDIPNGSQVVTELQTLSGSHASATTVGTHTTEHGSTSELTKKDSCSASQPLEKDSPGASAFNHNLLRSVDSEIAHESSPFTSSLDVSSSSKHLPPDKTARDQDLGLPKSVDVYSLRTTSLAEISPRQVIEIQPRRAVSSLFQTGGGQPYPIDEGPPTHQASQVPAPNFRTPFKAPLPASRARPLVYRSVGPSPSQSGVETNNGVSLNSPTLQLVDMATNSGSIESSRSPKRPNKAPESPSPLHRVKIHKTSQNGFKSNAPSNSLNVTDKAGLPASHEHTYPTETTSSPPLQRTNQEPANTISGGFTTASGAKVELSAEAVQRARARLDSATHASSISPSKPPAEYHHPPFKDISNAGAPLNTTPLLSATVKKNLNAIQSTSLMTIIHPTTNPASSWVPKADVLPSPAKSVMSTPVRLNPYAAPTTRSLNPLQESSPQIPAPYQSPIPVRRISNRIHIGLTPQSVSTVHRDAKGSGPRPFVTPFKRPTALVQHPSLTEQSVPFQTPINSINNIFSSRDLATPSNLKKNAVYAPNSKPIDKLPEGPVIKSIFDLSVRPGSRIAMSSWLASPKGFSGAHLMSLPIPEEVVTMTIKTAVVWNFNSMTEPFGPIHALDTLLKSGCKIKHSSPKWVANHWGLIIWKLAGMVRWQPDCLRRIWNPSYVLNQLKYRYEREFVRGERSAIRRILDHECPSNIPMCLCVCAIYGRTVLNIGKRSSANGAQPSADGTCLIELTDGWHKITATLDSVLERTVRSGKLKVGYKLAISGTGCEIPAEINRKASKGTPEQITSIVPSHYPDELRLRLEGNSTARAIWHEPLGFRIRPWFASLRSLTHDGGKISMVDIVVTKIFEPMFISDDGQRGRWGMTEEQMLQLAWEKERETEAEKISRERQRTYQITVEVLEALEEIFGGDKETRWTADSDSAAADDDFDAEEMCEDLIERVVSMEVLKSLPINRLRSLRGAIAERFARLETHGTEEAQKVLDQRVPPRRTRNIQLLRIRDFQTFRHPSQNRTAQLLVQDLSRVEDGLLQEGHRYWVQNIQPQRRLSWDARSDHVEILLGTRRDTKWRDVT